jgi:hypothetical protein
MISEATLKKASRAATLKLAAFQSDPPAEFKLVQQGIWHRKSTNEVVIFLSKQNKGPKKMFELFLVITNIDSAIDNCLGKDKDAAPFLKIHQLFY